MDFLKTVAGKIVAGFVALAVVIAGISFAMMDSSTRHALLSGTGKIIAWVGVVAVWPWITFALIGRVSRMASNAAGAVLVAAYTLAEVLLLLWMFDWHVAGRTAWSFVVVGALLAGAYNLLTCDWIAEKVE